MAVTLPVKRRMVFSDLIQQITEAASKGFYVKIRCSEKFHKIHWKTPVPESLFYRTPLDTGSKIIFYLVSNSQRQVFTVRSSHSQMFFKIGILKKFADITGKHLCWSLSLIKLQAFRKRPVGAPVLYLNAF